MANVKSRIKAPKSASTRGKGRGKKKISSTGKNANEPGMGKRSNRKIVTSDEKVQYLLPNSHLLSDRYSVKSSRHSNKIDKPLPILMTKSGRIRKKSKDNLKLIDNILKSELLIHDSKLKKPKHNHKVNNNNDVELTDQNKISTSKDSRSETIKKYARVKSKKEKQSANQKLNNKKSEDLVVQNSEKDDDISLKPNTKNMLENISNKNSEDTLDKNSSTTGQVTLSNGVVLTLSLFQCDYCQKTYNNKSSLRRHIYIHLNIKPHYCPHCPKKFHQRGILKVHIKKQHPEMLESPESHVCEICDKPFLLKENLELHIESHVKNENAYKCVYCDKKFSHQLLLMRHEKQHSASGRYQCTFCDMSYDCRARQTLHIKSHLKIKDYICQYCGKEFLRLNSLRRHVSICHGGHRIQCPICKKNLKGHLTEHMRTHEKKRPHECPECGQKFTQSTQLKVHRRSHTGDRPYTCRICCRPFSHSNALMLHIRRHTGEKPFPCAMCPLSFSQLPHMKAHMQKIHGKENPYKCLKCKQFFKLKVHLETHKKTCTVGDRELSFEEKIQASVQCEEEEVVSAMSLSRMRFLLALLLTMIASSEKLKYLGFNKRLIDDLLVESLEAMGHTPCKDESLLPLKRLKTNIEILLNGTVPKEQMETFRRENKTTEELLELLTDEKKSN